jgi:hypothetical protein
MHTEERLAKRILATNVENVMPIHGNIRMDKTDKLVSNNKGQL